MMTSNKTAVKVEPLVDRSVLVGEAPHWDERVQALYFVSVNEKTIHKYDAANKVLTSSTLDDCPTFIIPLENHLDQFVVGMGREIVIVQWGGADGTAKVVRNIGEVDHGTTNRINDGKADPRGRLYTGTMSFEDGKIDLNKYPGSLFRLDCQGITPLCNKISLSNGMAWDLETKAMYYIDSAERNIRRYDYDVETGDISNLQYIFDLDQHSIEGVPDGCTIDTDGNLWVAVFGGGCVLHMSPKGELLKKLDIPAKQVTSCTFGGANFDTLFVTTARLNIDGEQPPPSGTVFKVTGLGVKGHPNRRFKE